MVIQGYDRINWEDLPSQNTPINAENLNHMEDGIENLYAAIGNIDLDAIAADIAEVKEEVENFQPGVELTQEEYDDLTEEEKNNGTIYYIKDGDASAITAADAHYDNSTSGLTATDVQEAIDEVQGEIDVLKSECKQLTNGSDEIANYKLFYLILQDNWVTGVNEIGCVFARVSGMDFIRHTHDSAGYQNQYKVSLNVSTNTFSATGVYSSTPNQTNPVISAIYGII